MKTHMPLNVFGWCRNSGSAIYGASLPNVLGRTGGDKVLQYRNIEDNSNILYFVNSCKFQIFGRTDNR